MRGSSRAPAWSATVRESARLGEIHGARQIATDPRQREAACFIRSRDPPPLAGRYGRFSSGTMLRFFGP
jgi:hypothetical protein